MHETSHVTTVTSVTHRTYSILLILEYVYIVPIVNMNEASFDLWMAVRNVIVLTG